MRPGIRDPAAFDVVVTTGIHHLGPVEVVDGRPVLHGLGNFFWSDIGDGLGPDVFSNAETFESVIALSRFEGGRLAELRLHPVELGYGEPLTATGIPRVARPDRADTILGRLRELSGPYGTEIAIEPSGDSRVGVIRG
jgi:poly-gamma-glutamate capsule biosynthesis protein CapA/YwtB (metallophosphatase superfamily)